MSIDVFLTSIYGALGQGLLHALVAIGIFLNLRVMRKPDLTVEGSFAFGGAIAMTMLAGGSHFAVVLMIAPLGGAAAGMVTGLIHTKLKIDGIISGLLVTMALFSINLFVMGSSNISAPLDTFVNTPIRLWLVGLGMQPFNALLTSYIIVGVIVVALVITALYFLFRTEFGLSIRATGSNEYMARSNGINTDSRKIFVLVLSNAIIALSGALVVQQQSGASVHSGAGILVIGLAALVIGEVITPKKANMLIKLLFVVAGAFIYFSIISVVIISGLMSTDATRLLAAALTLIALCIPKIKQLWKDRRAYGRT
ncbi:MAG: ABC transporter permease [Firmicutes bacterium]|nr:ABC transporter permease [Bacillota bacterium]